MQSKRSSLQQLDRIFKPKSIAIIGGSVRPEAAGYTVMRNLIAAGFQGQLVAINPKYSDVQGKPCYRSIGRAPGPIDLAVITTPNRTIPELVKECGEAGVGGIVIISGSFKDMGEARHDIYADILRTARQYGMRIVGPNSIGIINPHLAMQAAYTRHLALRGNIAFLSQSGALCTSILDWANDQNVGFSYFISVGSMTDINYADLIDYLGTDTTTTSILIYMENLHDARRFMSAARAFARSKPILVLKAGKSREGSQATLSHTDALIGDDDVYDTALQRAGVVRVERVAQLFHSAQALAMQSRPRGNRLAILTNAVAPGVLATDYLIQHGGQLAPLSKATIQHLRTLLPTHWNRANPIDLPNDATAATYAEVLRTCMKDANTDGVLAIFTAHLLSDANGIAQALGEAAAGCRKPVLACCLGEQDVATARDLLEQRKVPSYRYPESAVDVFLKMYDYTRNLQLLYETPASTPEEFTPDTETASSLILEAIAQKRSRLDEVQSRALLQCYDIPVSRHVLVRSAAAAVQAADMIGYPVAMKIVAPDIIHKTDVHGVRLHVASSNAVRRTFSSLMDIARQTHPDAPASGVLVEEMLQPAFELFIGARKDPIFGPVIAFGQGGVAVEILKDTRLGLPPLNMAMARQLIEGTRLYPMLEGYRNQQGVNLQELAFTLYKFSYLLMDFPEIASVDINPFIAGADFAAAVNAQIVLDPAVTRRKGHDYQHLVISPYPAKYTRNVQLRDGSPAILRPIRPEDEPLVMRMFDYLSKESLYFRFFGYVPQVSHEFLTRYTQIDYDREIAIIAEIQHEKERKMIGVVRIIADAWGESAEYAIMIADPWQKQGLGSLLTDFILEIARDRDIRKIYASVLANNKGMIRLFEKKGFTVRRDGYDAYYVELLL